VGKKSFSQGTASSERRREEGLLRWGRLRRESIDCTFDGVGSKGTVRSKEKTKGKKSNVPALLERIGGGGKGSLGQGRRRVLGVLFSSLGGAQSPTERRDYSLKRRWVIYVQGGRRGLFPL